MTVTPLNRETATALLTDAIGQIAPELDLATVDPDAELRTEADLDSIDFLRLVEIVADATGLEIPERDYPQLLSLAGFAVYLTAQSAAA